MKSSTSLFFFKHSESSSLTCSSSTSPHDHEDTAPYCRICWNSAPTTTLVSPCKCKGSLGHVHLPCLRQQKLYLLQKGVLNLYKAIFTCEVCKGAYSLSHQETLYLVTPFTQREEEAMKRGTKASSNPSDNGIHLEAILGSPISGMGQLLKSIFGFGLGPGQRRRYDHLPLPSSSFDSFSTTCLNRAYLYIYSITREYIAGRVCVVGALGLVAAVRYTRALGGLQ